MTPPFKHLYVTAEETTVCSYRVCYAVFLDDFSISVVYNGKISKHATVPRKIYGCMRDVITKVWEKSRNE
jgi:hypothetical protein